VHIILVVHLTTRLTVRMWHTARYGGFIPYSSHAFRCQVHRVPLLEGIRAERIGGGAEEAAEEGETHPCVQ